MIIDAHVHLWKEQKGIADGKPVMALSGGRSSFAGETVQMMPPYMADGVNSAELLLANMDYAGVNGCVVTQEYIDGNQDAYLLEVRSRYPDRFRICSLYEEAPDYALEGFDGIKVCAARLTKEGVPELLPLFKLAEKEGKFISIDLQEGAAQAAELRELIEECPDLRIAVGHFGMVNRPGWEEQVKLARYPGVYLESGGITWLFHKEFYPYKEAVDAILRASDICGEEKLMWGSDYPRTMTAITYKMSHDFVSGSDRIAEGFKRKFLYENAAGFYGFGAMEELPHIKNMVE